MRDAYPDLERNREFVLKVIEQEEARFYDTLEVVRHEIKAKIEFEAMSGTAHVDKKISSQEVFRYYDTKGSPPELTKAIAAERIRLYGVDMEGI